MDISKFVAGLFITACPVFALAQSAIQYQRGDDNQVQLQQLGGIGSSSQQYQDGTGNLSRIAQSGDYNNAQVRQRSSFSEAVVTQDGHYNQARIYQGGSGWDRDSAGGSGWRAEVVQLGNANQVTLQQDQGFGSGAYLHQEGNRNVHQLRQDGYPNRLEARSIGDDNRVVVDQIGGFGSSRVAQMGNANQVSIRQQAFSNHGAIEVTQQGFANQATITQNAVWRSVGTLELEQIGSSNSMTVDHSNGANRFRFTQDGVGNRLDAVQSGPVLGFGGYSIGNRNQVDVLQIYYDADLTISQIGDDNVIQTEQYGLHRKSASIDQLGNVNQAILSQTAGFTSNQLATIIQHGTGNQATALQQ
jgi:hypothetical protein